MKCMQVNANRIQQWSGDGMSCWTNLRASFAKIVEFIKEKVL